jgi:hypothetical protein
VAVVLTSAISTSAEKSGRADHARIEHDGQR